MSKQTKVALGVAAIFLALGGVLTVSVLAIGTIAWFASSSRAQAVQANAAQAADKQVQETNPDGWDVRIASNPGARSNPGYKPVLIHFTAGKNSSGDKIGVWLTNKTHPMGVRLWSVDGAGYTINEELPPGENVFTVEDMNRTRVLFRKAIATP